MKQKIIDFLNNEEEEIEDLSLPREPLENYQKIFEELGIDIDLSNLQTNGWQVDFWWTFDYKDRKYCLSGGLWYGQDYSLSKEDQDDEYED